MKQGHCLTRQRSCFSWRRDSLIPKHYFADSSTALRRME